ncbi:dabb-domain-containing protein, partial [Paraphaeosphaeria sporulosa]
MALDNIMHIVLFKYRTDVTWSDLEDHFKSFMSLKTRSLHPQSGLPLIKSLRAGKNTSWEPFSKGMTHAFILEFASQDDLDYYLTAEPVHVQFSKDAKPLIEDSLVVDIRDGVL